MTKLLSRTDVMDILTMEDTITILEKAFTDLSNKKAVLPQRSLISASEHHGLALFMPAYLKGMGALGAKVATVYPECRFCQGNTPAEGSHVRSHTGK